MNKLNVSMLMVGFFLVGGVLRAEKTLAFMDSSVDRFIDRVVTDQLDKRAFKKYFDMLQEKVEESDKSKKRATKQYLCQVALNSMEKKNKDWYEQINSFFSDVRFTLDETFDSARSSMRQFLVWYGAYEEYLTAKMLVEGQSNKQQSTTTVDGANSTSAQDEVQVSFLGKITSYASGLGNKVAGFFGFGDNSKTS